MSAYQQFSEYMGRINDLCCVANLLLWDERTQMPRNGGLHRGPQFSTVIRAAQEQFQSGEMDSLIRGAEAEVRGEDPDSYRFRNVLSAREAFERVKKVPLSITTAQAQLISGAQAAWETARKESNFSIFQPWLEKMVAIKQQLAEAIGYADHPYDALLYRYEPGMTAARLRQLFGDLKSGVLPVLEHIQSRPEPRNDFLYRDYEPEAQRRFAAKVVQEFGYDMGRGRIDTTIHPFEISFTREDVRITTRYNRNYLPMALFGLFHESGHGMYEQGADPAISRSALTTDLLAMYAVAGVSFGMHESQSRLWENMVGRSRPFWRHYYPDLQGVFPEMLEDVSEEEFYRAVNRVCPSYIRVEADEITYNFHIMLRVEAEMGMLDGSVKVSDLPDFWNARMKEYLGIEPRNHTEGVLQDIHWAAGDYGSFPCYTIGNIIAAQIFKAASDQLQNLDDQIAEGDFASLHAWLGENIYRHGRAFSSEELLVRMTGNTLSTSEYVSYIEEKYLKIYE